MITLANELKSLHVRVSVQSELDRVDDILLVGNDRVVVHSISSETTSEIIIYDSSSTLLKTIQLPIRSNQIGCINNTEIICLFPKIDEWRVIDVFDYAERIGRFAFFDADCRVVLKQLPDSMMLCFLEQTFTVRRSKVTFLPYPVKECPCEEAYWRPEIEECLVKIGALDLSSRIVAYPSAQLTGKVTWMVLDYAHRLQYSCQVDTSAISAEQCRLAHIEQPHKNYFILSLHTSTIKRLYVFDNSIPNQPLVALSEPSNFREVMGIGSELYFFDKGTELNSCKELAEVQIFDRTSMKLLLKSKLEIGPGIIYDAGRTILPRLERFWLVSYGGEGLSTKSGFVVELSRYWLERALDHRTLYLHMLKELSHRRMNHEMLQWVIDAFKEE